MTRSMKSPSTSPRVTPSTVERSKSGDLPAGKRASPEKTLEKSADGSTVTSPRKTSLPPTNDRLSTSQDKRSSEPAKPSSSSSPRKEVPPLELGDKTTSQSQIISDDDKAALRKRLQEKVKARSPRSESIGTGDDANKIPERSSPRESEASTPKEKEAPKLG